MKTQYGYEVKFKDPVKYDDAKLKQMTCSHIDQYTFIARNGAEEQCCKACKTFESDLPVKEETGDYCEMCEKYTKTEYEMPNGDYVCLDCYSGLADRAEAQYDSLRDEGKI